MQAVIRHSIFLLIFSLWSHVNAAQVAGVTLPDKLELDGTPLQLNGAGIRSKFFVKVYVGALYLPNKEKNAAAIIAMNAPTRVSMHVLYHEVSKEKLTGGWTDGFENNQSSADLSKLKARLDQFNALFDSVKQGDVVNIDYLPGKGTRVMMNDQIKGIVPGEDFHRAVMQVWLGEVPADATLKSGMLGVD